MLQSLVQKADARRTAAKKRLQERTGFRKLMSTEGAIDLASIMVGVIIVGILAGIIAASVFGVIPWSQDNGARQALDAVKTAETTAYAMGAADGKQVFYEFNGDEPGDIVLQESDNVTIHLSTDKKKYAAVSVSATGHAFVLDGQTGVVQDTEYATEALATDAAEALVAP